MRVRWFVLAAAAIASACGHTPQQQPKEKNNGGDPLFVQAAHMIQQGEADRLWRQLQKHAYLANARDERTRKGRPYPRSLLHILAEPPAHRLNRVKMARMLIRGECEVDGRLHYNHGETPLHWAARSGDVELIETLIEHGAAVDATGGHIDNGTPLVIAVHYGQTEAAQTLVSHGAEIFNFPLAAGLGREDLMKQFIRHGRLLPGSGRKAPGAPALARLSKYNVTKIYQQAFNYAVFNHRFSIADALIKSGVDINYQWGENSYTLLHRVAERGSKDMAKYLIERGAHINDSTADGITPVQVAAKSNNARVESVLRRFGAYQ
jgi:hypothetical protein